MRATFVLGASLVIGGCSGLCSRDYVRRLDAPQATMLAKRAAQNGGWDLSSIAPENIQANYSADTCDWGVLFVLHPDQLPVGPLVIVDDRSGRAGVGPEM